MGKYAESSKVLDQARDKVRELYTTRISGKLKSFVGSDASDLYYGEKYEASFIYFVFKNNDYNQNCS